MSAFSEWDSFYVIVGSAAGALIGLQFVVMTLIAARPSSAPEGGRAFATPTVTHFIVVLLISALARVPWPEVIDAALAFGVVGICGTGYALIVTRRLYRQKFYRPDAEDWFFHAVVPVLSYATLALSGFAGISHMHEALFGVATAILCLLFGGIHNAWDMIAFQVFVRNRPKDES